MSFPHALFLNSTFIIKVTGYTFFPFSPQNSLSIITDQKIETIFCLNNLFHFVFLGYNEAIDYQSKSHSSVINLKKNIFILKILW